MISEEFQLCEKSSDWNSPIKVIWDNGHPIDFLAFYIFPKKMISEETHHTVILPGMI